MAFSVRGLSLIGQLLLSVGAVRSEHISAHHSRVETRLITLADALLIVHKHSSSGSRNSLGVW